MLEYMCSVTSSVGLVILTVTLVVAYVIRSWLTHPSDLPPMPCRPVPFFGHTLYFKPTRREAMLEWRKRLGKIYSFYMGSQLVIVLSNYTLLNEALIKQADRFSDRPDSYINRMWKANRHGIAHNSGPSWKAQRTVSMSILRDFGMGKNWLAEKISEEVDGYMKVLEEMKGEARDIKLLTNTAVSNVICAILFGQRFDYDDDFLKYFVNLNSELLRLGTLSSSVSVMPWLRFLPGDRFKVKEYLSTKLYMNELFSEKFIDQFKDSANDTTSDNFIKSYLREMYKRGKSDQNNPLTETHLKRIIDILFLAGTDTTSTTLLWAFAFCIHYPDCQKKLYQEIVEEVGTSRLPKMQDKPKLKYLNAFVLETQRIGSVVPLGVSHLCSETTHVGGYRIPKGTHIIPFLDAVMKDEKVWKDPFTFNPERFLDEDGKVFQPDAFVPFSLGRRVCLGESLAKMELFLFLSAIIQRFEILPEDPLSLPPLLPSKETGLSSLPNYKLRMKKRTNM